MQPVSPKWAPALTTDHGLSTKVDVLFDGHVVAADIPFVDGSVKVDRGSDVRRSLSLSIPDPASFPVNPSDPFAVYGQRIYVESGIQYLDGSVERVPLGEFVITSVGGDIHTGPLTVQGNSLEYLAKRYLFDAALSTTQWRNAVTFLATYLPMAVPGAQFVNDSAWAASVTLPTKTWDPYTDAWSVFRDVAESVGCELFCDANGTFRLQDVPDPLDVSQTPVWEVSAGAQGVMVSATMELSGEGVYNRVIVTGENSADNVPAVRAIATIDGPTDPLRFGGPFGEVTKHVSSSLVTTQAQANEMAKALLNKYRAPNRSVTLETVPNPALDASDRIRVNYGSAHAPEIHMAYSFDIPLAGGGFTISTVSGVAED